MSKPTTEFILTSAEKQAAALRASLPRQVDGTQFPRTDRGPFMVVSFREALLWRMAELAEAGLAAVRANQAVAATLLARALIECLAIAHEISNAARDAASGAEAASIRSRLDPFMFGSRADADYKPRAPRIGKSIERLDGAIPGMKAAYGRLSEVAHPNYLGVASVFMDLNTETHIATFGATKLHGDLLYVAVGCIDMVMGSAVEMYNTTADDIERWLGSLGRAS